MFFSEKAQLELPTPYPLHPLPLYIRFFLRYTPELGRKKLFLKFRRKLGSMSCQTCRPLWKCIVFLWFWLCFRTRNSETLHFPRISCPGGHPQVRVGSGFSKLPMGPCFFSTSHVSISFCIGFRNTPRKIQNHAGSPDPGHPDP